MWNNGTQCQTTENGLPSFFPWDKLLRRLENLVDGETVDIEGITVMARIALVRSQIEPEIERDAFRLR